MRVGTLRWATGVFCAVTGAMVLVAPHQFAIPAYRALQPHLFWWGAAFLLAGGGLLAAGALAPARPVTAGVHLLAGAVLLLIAQAVGGTGGVAGAVVYGALGLGTVAAPFVPRVGREPSAERDLLGLVIAGSAALLGAALLVRPDLFQSPPADAVRALRTALPAVLLGGGAALLYAQVRPTPRGVVWAGHLALAAAYGALAVLFALPSWAWTGPWTGLGYYGGLGTAVALLPWLAPRLRRIDPTSLRTRIALALIAAASVPLLIAVTAIADQAERAEVARASTEQELRAIAQSQNVGDYVRRRLGVVSTVAARSGALALAPGEQRGLLRSLVATDVFALDVVAFSTYDAAGQPLARSDDLPPAPLPSALVDEVRRTGAASVRVAASQQSQRPVFLFAAPVPGAGGQVRGFVGSEIEWTPVAAALARLDPDRSTGASVFLVDAEGRAIAHPDPSPMASMADVSRHPAVAAVLAGGSGALRYRTAGGEQLAGYAPVPGLGWGVVVERPVAMVLASTLALRDLSFGFLLLVVAVAALAGVLAADRLAAPLGVLADAVDRLAAGDAAAPLPASGIGDVARLTALFRQMRDRLAARTAERARAEAALQESEERARQVVATALDAVVTMDAEGQIDGWNAQAEAIFGWPRAEALGRRVVDTIIPPRDRTAHERGLRHFLATGEGAVLNRRVELTALRRDGREFPVELAVTALRRNGVWSFSAFVRDITERTRAEEERARLLEAERAARTEAEAGQQREALLASASALLAASLDYETTLRQVAQLAVPRLADWCTVDVLDDDGRVRRVAAAHADPTREGLVLEAAQRYPMRLDEPRGVAVALRTGEPQLQPELTDQDLRTAARDERHLSLLRELAPRSAVILPLVARGRRLGALSFTLGDAGRRYTGADLVLAEELAGRAAVAIDNARLYGEARAAEAQVRALNRALVDRERRLHDLVGRLLTAQEDERRRVASDVHDGLAQVAAGAHEHLQTFARHHRPRAAAARQELDRALDLAQRTIREARRVIAGLRPTALDDFGLAAALRLEVEALQADGWAVTYEEGVGAERLPPAVETALFRAGQEALTNVRKHAGDTRVHVALRRTADAVRLDVQDWGRGFALAPVSNGAGPGERVGLPGMSERVALLGGRCEVSSQVGQGTRLAVEVPLPAPVEG